MSRSALVTTIIALCLLAPIGCAVTSNDEAAEEVAETQADELSSVANTIVGNYYDSAVPFAGIGRINLGSNGKYTAQIEAGGRAACITSPCLLPESGTWNATKGTSGSLRLRLSATGEPSRYYSVKKKMGQFELSAPGKASQTLTALGATQCLDDADCSANQECGPKVCLMWCAVGDPFCCGPSTCQPKTPGPKACGGFAGIQCGSGETCVDDRTDSCDPKNHGVDCSGTCQPSAPNCSGAWLDQNGLCRTPADGVYPAECCGGPKCGNAQCASGEVCCNSLSGICTKPGEFCAF